MNDRFLAALEDTSVCSAQAGWQPNHIVVDDRIHIPAYVKSHSWGEYVFDWAWASAYDQYGLHYYPKLVVCAPYTPSVGPRFLGADGLEDIQWSVETLKHHTRAQHLSGFHILFPDQQQQTWLDECGLLKRTDVQFHWYNQDYRDFNDFLDRFSSRKRKNVRKERLSIPEQGIQMRTIEGAQIKPDELDAFYQFYHATYLKRGRQGYLNKSFFKQLQRTMPEKLVLVMAELAGRPIAGALFFKDSQTLYGRYWGCFEEYKNLHFEACYYQGIDYCIRHGLTRFDPGTQGEHKIARGFEPTFTHSYHWLENEPFFEAAQRFCVDEANMTQEYYADVTAALPFKRTD